MLVIGVPLVESSALAHDEATCSLSPCHGSLESSDH